MDVFSNNIQGYLSFFRTRRPDGLSSNRIAPLYDAVFKKANPFFEKRHKAQEKQHIRSLSPSGQMLRAECCGRLLRAEC